MLRSFIVLFWPNSDYVMAQGLKIDGKNQQLVDGLKATEAEIHKQRVYYVILYLVS